MPTPEQIAQLQRNTAAMVKWVNHLHDYLQDPLNEVYLKLTQPTAGDPGQAWISRINGVMFSLISMVDFPGAGIGSDFLQALAGSYDNPEQTPDSLKAVFGDVWARFSATFLQLNDDLGKISADPAGNWDRVIAAYTGGVTCPVDALASSAFLFPFDEGEGPDPDPVAFNELTDKMVASFRYNLTKNVIGQKWSILHDPNVNFEAGWNDDTATQFAKVQISVNRDVFLTWHPDQGGTCAGCPSNGMAWSEPRLGVGQWYSNWDYFHGESPSRDLCDWLFQDDGFGTVFNPNAIATRREVFYEWPIPGNLNEHPQISAPPKRDVGPEATEEDRWRAQRWHEFFKEVPRRDVEEILIAKALEDPAFKRDLRVRPREALLWTFGLGLPSNAKITVIEEQAGEYVLVIPRIGRPQRSWLKRWLWRLLG